MPAIIIAIYLSMFGSLAVIDYTDSQKQQQINKLCIEKFKTPKEIKECKMILTKVGG